MLIVCVVSIYFVINFYGKSLEAYRISQRATDVRREIVRLEADIRRLKAQVAYYQTDDYIELTARDKLNLVRPGDRPVIVLPVEPTPLASGDEEMPVARPPADARRTPRDPELGHLPGWVALIIAPRD